MNDRFEYLNQKGNGSNNFLKWPYLNKEHFSTLELLRKLKPSGNMKSTASCKKTWLLCILPEARALYISLPWV